ncbi:meiosis inhibitor protein 1 isoform X2 [Lissotriton helveticus]
MQPGVDVLFQRVHYRHNPQWLLTGPAGGSLCLACVTEMLEEPEVSVVRKKYMLSCFRHILHHSAAAVTELLMQDPRICAHFLGTLLGMLQEVEDGTALYVITEVLMQLIVELKSEQFVHCILDECHKELTKVSSMRSSLPVFTFLGKLVDAIPSIAEMFVVEHGNLLEHLPMGLVYPNEGVKAAVCYLYGKLYCSPNIAEKLSPHFTERLCGIFLATLENAQTRELQINCLGFLKQLLNLEHLVSMIMSMSGTEMDSENTELLHAQSALPLVLKKILLSRDELMQVASAQCMACVLVHSPAKYAAAFIHADIPEFLFEQLSCTSEVLIWSIYCCLLLLAEERLFFSKCHTVYGIESVVRSLKEVPGLNNVELHKQGLLLLTEILRRQPADIKLFTNINIFKDIIKVLQEAVASPVLDVATEAVNAASAFLSKEHLSIPVQYEDMQRLVEAVLKRCNDLSLPAAKHRSMGHTLKKDQSRNISRSGHFLHRALQSFQNAVRLALDCRTDPSAQENAFTVPYSENKYTLDTFAEFLLRICDSHCIPLVMKHYTRAPSPELMEVFFSILTSLFTVVPTMKEKFAIKLASTAFIRLTLEVKATFCTGQSNSNLNQASSGFLCCLCCDLFSTTQWKCDSKSVYSDVSRLLQQTLPLLNYSIPESLALISEFPVLSTDESLRAQQHSLLLIFCLAHIREDRFIQEEHLFCAVQAYLQSVQDQGVYPPSFVFRAVLYLLSVCQDTCHELDGAALKTIDRAVDSTLDLSSLYYHHPLFLKFFLRYPLLADHFGHWILELWLSNEDYRQSDEMDILCELPKTADSALVSPDSLDVFLQILSDNSTAILTLLDLVFSTAEDIAKKVLFVLKRFLIRSKDFLITDFLRSKFLQILQRLLIENSSAELQANTNLPLSLGILWLLQVKEKYGKELGGIDLKLLYHEVALLLSNVPFMEVLQMVLEVTWTESLHVESSSSALSTDELLCSAWLLLSSLVYFQHRYNSGEIHSKILVELGQILNIIIYQKKNKSSLLLVSLVLFLRTILKQNFSSSLVVTTQSEARRLPLNERDASLYPLNMQTTLSLLIAFQNLLIQKDPLLQLAVCTCLEALLDFVNSRNKEVALHMASQPWNRCVLNTVLNSGENSFLQPVILRLMALFLRYEARTILSPGEIICFLQQNASLPVCVFPVPTCRALHLLLVQLQKAEDDIEPAAWANVQTQLENLQGNANAWGWRGELLCVGRVAVCLSHVGD